MPRIVGVDVPKEKRIEIALTYILGIGRTSSNKILKSANVNPSTRAKDLNEEEISRIMAVMQKDYKTEGDLRREVVANIKRLSEIGAYRGYRHRRGLPVSKTNARTRKGPRKTVGVVRSKAARAVPK